MDTRQIEKYDAVYLGDDFCQNLVPTLDQVLHLKSNFEKKIVLVTSIATDEDLRVIAGLMERVAGVLRDPEVVVNDLGLMALLHREFKSRVKLLAGRLIARDFEKYPAPFLEEFFARYGLSAMETDRFDAVDALSGKTGIRFHFHYPFQWLAVTRVCPHVGLLGGGDCGYACAARSRMLYGPNPAEPLFLKGSAYFTMFDGVPPHERRVSRLIYTPAS